MKTESGIRIRRLTVVDVDAALDLCAFEDLTRDVLSLELSSPQDYVWIGVHSDDDRLVAVHRGIRWHRHLMLKGLFVADEFQATGTGLAAAFSIRDEAFARGFDGVSVWVENGKAEAHIAGRLRIAPSSPFLHRYLVPLPDVSEAGSSRAGAPNAGLLTVPLPRGPGQMVEELLGVEQTSAACTTVAWVRDRARLMISGNPCRSLADLDVFLRAVAQLGRDVHVNSVEIVFEATDLTSAFHLIGIGARRASRGPARFGSVRFPSIIRDAAPDVRIRAKPDLRNEPPNCDARQDCGSVPPC